MKQFFIKKTAMAAFALCTLPGTLLAQQGKDAQKEKKDHQQIVITLKGDKSEKTVVEIDGDKIKVNGKEAGDLKDVQVHVNKWSSSHPGAFRTPGAFSMTFDGFDQPFLRIDSNRAMLGVATQSDDRGAEITVVNKESAAEKAGLKKGDIITRIDNRKIDETDDVTDAIRSHKPGDKVTITYLRDDKEHKATAELGRWKGLDVKGLAETRALTENLRGQYSAPRYRQPAEPFGRVFISGSRPRLGLSVQDTDDGKGVKVLEVEDEGTAAKAGVKEDDIITHIDDKAVNSADEVSTHMREKKDQPLVRLQVLRGGKAQTIEVRIPRKLKTVDL